MHDDRAIVEARIRRTLRERIIPAIHPHQVPLQVRAQHVDGEPIPYAQAAQGEFVPFAVGDRWGPAWGTTWFHLTGSVPDHWEGHRVEVLVHIGYGGMVGFGGEALVWRDGQPLGGIHPEHRAVPVAERARGGEPVDLFVEAAANPDLSHAFTPTPFGDRATVPDAPLYRLNQAALAVRDDVVRDLWLDIRVLAGLMGQLPTNEPRRNEILRALERAMDRLDLHDLHSSAAEARAELTEMLSRPATASAHRITAIGHAHIDTAWMWPIRETRRKCARTFSTAVALMDEYPEYRFACSQAVQYQWVKEDHPDLYERIKEKVAAGQFVPVGGMWVEADCNIPSGESLVRQFLHGKQFFAREFGIEPAEVWIPDVFGYPANLPQIMRKAGCEFFLTQKISWNKTNRFPHHTFWWEGIDGSAVFTHFPPADTYNGTMKPAELIHAVHNFADHGRATRSLYPFGHGDGGGGPTREMLEMARRQADLEGAPRVEIDTPRSFFEAARDEYEDAPTWRGELYLEMHRGTYTTQARTKWGNRRGEILLRDAELWATTAHLIAAQDYPSELLSDTWEALLLHQFHDIIPGSSIAWVHQDTEADHRAVHASATEVIDTSLRALSSPDQSAHMLTVWNSTTHPRCEVVTFESTDGLPSGDLAAIGADGQPRALQRLTDGRLAFLADAPGLGAATYRLSRAMPAPQPAPVTVGDRSIDNGLVRVEWDGDGLLRSLVDVQSGREMLDRREPANVFRLHPDHPNEYDAWDIDHFYRHTHDDLTKATEVEVTESGPVVASVRIRREFGSSSIDQSMVVRQGSRRVDFVTRVDWNERERLLKVRFPVDVHTDSARYEVQFGHIERPTHSNTSWDAARFEVCAQRWADLSRPDAGVALLNDCKYGYDITGNVMSLTLLRSPGFPDPNADLGTHDFTYSLFAHPDDAVGPVIREAAALNNPMNATSGAVESGVPLLHVSGAAHVEAVKLAEDGTGDVIVRLYEAEGAKPAVQLRASFPVAEVREVDLLERDRRTIGSTADTIELVLDPFEVLTLRIRPA